MMIFNLVVLGVLLVAVILGFTQRVFDKMRLPAAVAVIAILAIAVGLVVPDIWIGSLFAMSVGGFIIPVLFALYLMLMIGFNSDLAKAFAAIVLVGGAVMGLRFLIPIDSVWMQIASGLIIGVVAGGISYLIGRSRRGALTSAVLGIVVAEIAYFLIARFALGRPVSLMLTGGMFGGMIVAMVIAVALAEIIGTVRERTLDTANNKLQYEAGSDFPEFDEEQEDMRRHDDYFKY